MKNHYLFYHSKKLNIINNKRDFGKKLLMFLIKIQKSIVKMINLNIKKNDILYY